MTEEMSAENHPTMCYVPYQIHCILEKLSDTRNTSESSKKLKNQLKLAVQDRVGWVITSDNVATRAACLHPDIKYSQFLSKGVKDSCWFTMTQEKLKQMDIKEDDKEMADFTAAEMNFMRKRLEGAKKFGDVSDCLKFWRNWPDGIRMNLIARKYLAIPATSTPSERAFSDIGYIYNSRRANLSCSNVEKMTFIRENSHILPKDISGKMEIFVEEKKKQMMQEKIENKKGNDK